MARIEYGNIVTRIRGAMGGAVFQRIGKTDSMRLNGYNRRNSSTSSITTTNQFQRLAALWNTLEQVQLNSWYTNADSWPCTDRWGTARSLSGYQLFMFVNRMLLLYDFDPILSCPVYTSPVWHVDGFTTLDVSANTAYCNMDANPEYGENGMLFISQLFPATYKAVYPKVKFCRLITSGESRYVNYYAAALAVWGRPPVVGERFYVQSRIIILDGTYKGCWRYSASSFIDCVA